MVSNFSLRLCSVTLNRVTGQVRKEHITTEVVLLRAGFDKVNRHILQRLKSKGIFGSLKSKIKYGVHDD